MSFYDVLGVSPTATPEEIRAAWRAVASLYHPDRAPPHAKAQAEARYKRAQRAYAILSDPEKRAAYDRDPSAFDDSAPASPNDAAPGDNDAPTGIPEVDDGLELVGSLVKIFAPAERIASATCAVEAGSRLIRRYVAQTRGQRRS